MSGPSDFSGTSSASLRDARARLAERLAGRDDAAAIADELFAAADVFAVNSGLRRALADSSRPAASRAGLVTTLFGSRLSEQAVELLKVVGQQRWSIPADLVGAIDQLAALAVAIDAERHGRLDELEDELFRFGRIVAGEPGLRTALSDPFAPAAAKRELLGRLLAARVTTQALRLVTQAAVAPRGRSLEASLAEYGRLAVGLRGRVVAEVRTAIELTGGQRERLAAALARRYGRQVHLNIMVDPRVEGGIAVRIGDELIDGSVASRLAELARRLAA